ncbi:MAG TPA: hypothetical protein VKZ62_00330, partial [Georgenia sp.]|nr:hypothetical protein [Georgenia sp.]
ARNNYGSTYMDTKSFRNTIANFDKIRNQVRLFNLYNCTFFTVCPRDKKYIEARTGRVHRTSRSDVTVGTVLWLDFDLDLLDDDVEKANEIALNTISQLNPFPNIIVKTPGGYHVYFLLDQVYPVEEISYTNRRLQKWTKADNCGDPVRIMRIPMGKHHKDPKNPKKVQIIHFDDSRRFTLDEFDHYPDVAKTILSEQKIVLPKHIPNVDLNLIKNQFIDTKLVDKIQAESLSDYQELTTTNKCPSRSERDFHIICQLIKSKIDVDIIVGIFSKFPCGNKYREKGIHGDSYLIHQIESAKQRLEEPQPQLVKINLMSEQNDETIVNL